MAHGKTSKDRARNQASQAPDVLPPSRHQAVQFRITAFIMHATLTEREFVLRVYERCRYLRSRPVDAACPQHSIIDNGPVLLRCHRAPDFVRQLLADHTSFPQSASPHCKRHYQPEWSENRELNKTTRQEGFEKPDVGVRFAFGGVACLQRPSPAQQTARCLTCEPQWREQAPLAGDAPKRAVNNACPPSPKSVYRAPSWRPYAATPSLA